MRCLYIIGLQYYNFMNFQGNKYLRFVQELNQEMKHSYNKGQFSAAASVNVWDCVQLLTISIYCIELIESNDHHGESNLLVAGTGARRNHHTVRTS